MPEIPIGMGIYWTFRITLGKKSNSWRNLNIKMATAHMRQGVGFEVCLNGTCHWWGYEEECSGKEHDQLVSFNMSTDVFHVTPIDCRSSCYGCISRRLVLVALNGSVAMITNAAENNCFDITILGEVGVEESWTKIFTIGPLLGIEHPIGVGNKGDIFFIKKDDELVCFDLTNQSIEKIGLKGQEYGCQIAIYKESFLPIDGISQ